MVMTHRCEIAVEISCNKSQATDYCSSLLNKQNRNSVFFVYNKAREPTPQGRDTQRMNSPSSPPWVRTGNLILTSCEVMPNRQSRRTFRHQHPLEPRCNFCVLISLVLGCQLVYCQLNC